MKVTRTSTPDKEALLAAIEELNQWQSLVGWFDSAKYPSGVPVAAVAFIQEMGSAKRKIPPRPFMRPTAAAKSNGEWKDKSTIVFKRVGKGKMTAEQAFEAIGLMVQGDIRVTISQLQDPPLSILTLLARKHREGFTKDKATKKKVYNTVTGKTLGLLSQQLNAGPPDLSGVSRKPLVDTRYMINTLTSVTKRK